LGTRSAAVDFEALFNASPNAYVLLNPDLTIVGANDAYLRVTGRRREDMIGRKMFDAFPGGPYDPGGASVRQLRASLERVLRERVRDTLAVIRYAVPRKTPEGEIVEDRYWSATHTPILDDRGEVALILQHTVDITELQRFREAAAAARPTELPADQIASDVFRRAQAVQEANWLLDAERRHLRQLFEQAPGFIAVMSGPQHVFKLANAAYRRLVGDRDVIGQPAKEALPETVEQGFVELLDRVHATGEPFVGRGMRVVLQREPTAPAAEVFLDFVYQPIIGPDGAVSGIFVQGHDITELKRAEEALRRSAERLLLAKEAGGVATWDWDIVHGSMWVSDSWWRLVGLAPGGPSGSYEEWLARVHPEDRPRVAAEVQRALGGAPFETEYRVVWPNGEVHCISARGRAEFGPDGRPIRLLGASIDITERKQAEERLQLLAREVDHRAKNMLTVVQALVRMTRADTARDYAQAVEGRIAALARAHMLLAESRWAGTDLKRLIEDEIAPYRGGDATRVRAAGMAVMLNPAAAQALAMALHELATNAAKYGALSAPQGRVAIDWAWAADGRFCLRWTETGGPAVHAPARRGFGARLIDQVARQQLGGEARLDWRVDGLVCELIVPAENIGPVRA